MIHRRHEGGLVRYGINYDFNEFTLFVIIIRFPLPIYNFDIYFRVRNLRNKMFSKTAQRFIFWTKFWKRGDEWIKVS